MGGIAIDGSPGLRHRRRIGAVHRGPCDDLGEHLPDHVTDEEAVLLVDPVKLGHLASAPVPLDPLVPLGEGQRFDPLPFLGDARRPRLLHALPNIRDRRRFVRIGRAQRLKILTQVIELVEIERFTPRRRGATGTCARAHLPGGSATPTQPLDEGWQTHRLRCAFRGGRLALRAGGRYETVPRLQRLCNLAQLHRFLMREARIFLDRLTQDTPRQRCDRRRNR